MKKIGFLTLLITATLLLTLAFPVGAAGPKPVSASAAAAIVAPVPPPHPRVEQALAAMREAREHMSHAEGDFHGHRDKAIGHLDAAIHEAETCLREQ